jgi:hypothetical protein
MRENYVTKGFRIDGKQWSIFRRFRASQGQTTGEVLRGWKESHIRARTKRFMSCPD